MHTVGTVQERHGAEAQDSPLGGRTLSGSPLYASAGSTVLGDGTLVLHIDLQFFHYKFSFLRQF